MSQEAFMGALTRSTAARTSVSPVSPAQVLIGLNLIGLDSMGLDSMGLDRINSGPMSQVLALQTLFAKHEILTF